MVVKKSILQFCTTDYPYLFENKHVSYKKKLLKTSYIIDLMHTFLFRKYLYKKDTMHLWSVLLRKRYGTLYNYYVDWLLDHRIIELKKKWRSGHMSKLYKLTLNVDSKNVTRVYNYDKILLKKLNIFKKEYDDTLTFVYKTLVDDLNKITIEYNDAKKELDEELKLGLITSDSHFKNLLSIESIKNNILYTSKDKFGRMHTNFTSLKRSIRNNFLKINGNEIDYLDIKNCHPKLLGKMLLNEENEELKLYVKSVKENVFYKSFDEFNLSKEQIKKMVFQVFYGKNRNNKNNIFFKKKWPVLWQWIVFLKNKNNNSKYLCNLLQTSESNLIFNKICFKIKTEHPHIALFTVHDGVFFEKQYSNLIIPIFDKYENEII